MLVPDPVAVARAVLAVGFAFFTALIADLSQERQDAAWAEVEQALKRFEGADGFAGPSEVNLAVGRKPMG
jgi:hypothetical protein